MKSITVEAKIETVDKVTEFVNEVLEEKELLLVLCNSNKSFDKEEKILKL